MDYKSKISTSYKAARTLIQQNNPKDARVHVLNFIKLAQEIYHTQTIITQKSKTRKFIEKWVLVAATLRENGITDEILACFELNTEVPVNKKSVSKIEDFDLNELELGPSSSQGWAADTFERYRTAVVCIHGTSATGTGFIISKNGFLLTNDHVLFNGASNKYYSKIAMSFAKNKKTYNLQLIATDKKWDVALCMFKIEDIPTFSIVPRIKNYSCVKQGADILVIGNSFSMGLAPFTGTIKYVHDEATGDLVYTAPSNPGDSGGPVFNRVGECIGINKSITKSVSINGSPAIEANGITNATPMNKIDELLAKWTQIHRIIL